MKSNVGSELSGRDCPRGGRQTLRKGAMSEGAYGREWRGANIRHSGRTTCRRCNDFCPPSRDSTNNSYDEVGKGGEGARHDGNGHRFINCPVLIMNAFQSLTQLVIVGAVGGRTFRRVRYAVHHHSHLRTTTMRYHLFIMCICTL